MTGVIVGAMRTAHHGDLVDAGGHRFHHVPVVILTLRCRGQEHTFPFLVATSWGLDRYCFTAVQRRHGRFFLLEDSTEIWPAIWDNSRRAYVQKPSGSIIRQRGTEHGSRDIPRQRRE